ncbi:hypothetical protein OEA41_005463 [Lepraria neglecta]|uniref:Uncharacterized protein n=1 Tax=Lepraria neglecta TaxID=209136 RepID=A0AAE0DH22_9LECA|nr:hypothetical protein OEA41_005463 [Lepraria neglecta]
MAHGHGAWLKPHLIMRHTNPQSHCSEETPDQQKGSGDPTFIAGTTAHTQCGAAETFGPEPQRPSADELSTYKSNREHHDLLGVGSQTFNTGDIQYKPRTARMEETSVCPYHRLILQERLTNPCSGQGLGPMDRYLAEGPSERYAILHRPDAGTMSTYKGCRCIEMMESSIDTNDHAQK